MVGYGTGAFWDLWTRSIETRQFTFLCDAIISRTAGGGVTVTSFNYVNPVCCVATVCLQVRCMCWGHLGHFHRATSHLKWYKIVCMRYLACTFSQVKSINMFPCFCNLDFPDISFGDLLQFEHRTSLFSCLFMALSRTYKYVHGKFYKAVFSAWCDSHKIKIDTSMSTSVNSYFR